MSRPEPPGTTDGDAAARANRSCVALLLERFPHLRSISLALLHRHETFRELCEEYEACSATSERLEREGGDDALRREYSALQLRLEGELLRYIEDNTSRDQR